MQIQELLNRLQADTRWEGFQGVIINADGSLLVSDRWHGKYFSSVDELFPRDFDIVCRRPDGTEYIQKVTDATSEAAAIAAVKEALVKMGSTSVVVGVSAATQTV